MDRIDTNAALWVNIQALMLHSWGKENVQRLARECKVGPATIMRIKEQKTSVGLEVIEKVAEHFHLAPWQLLVPGMDPSNPPTLKPVTAFERKLYEKVMSVTKEIAAEVESKQPYK